MPANGIKYSNKLLIINILIIFRSKNKIFLLYINRKIKNKI